MTYPSEFGTVNTCHVLTQCLGDVTTGNHMEFLHAHNLNIVLGSKLSKILQKSFASFNFNNINNR